MYGARLTKPFCTLNSRGFYRIIFGLISFSILAFPVRLCGQSPFKPYNVSHEEFLTRNESHQETQSLDFLEPELRKRFKIYAGVSLPMGEFKNNSIQSEGSGFAQLGFSGGMEYAAEVTQGVGFIISGMISANAQDVSDWKKIYPWFTFDGETHVDYWVMGGLLVDKDFSPKVSAYGFAQLGMLYADYPNLTALDAFNGKLTITAPAVFTLGYSAGVGMNVKNYDISVRYLGGNPEFQPTAKLDNQKLDYPKVQKSVSAIQIMVGYVVN